VVLISYFNHRYAAYLENGEKKRRGWGVSGGKRRRNPTRNRRYPPFLPAWTHGKRKKRKKELPAEKKRNDKTRRWLEFTRIFLPLCGQR